VEVPEFPKMMGPATPSANEFGDEVPTPRVPADVPRVRPPANVDVPSPFTFKRFEMEKLVDDAIGRMEEPVIVRPPWRMVSPAETLKPFEVVMPDVEMPPEKLEVPAPVETILPPVRRRSPTVDSMPDVDLRPAEEMPPEKVEVPVPETVMTFATLKLVVDAIGKVEAAEVEVAMKVAAVGDEVAAMLVVDVQYANMSVPPVPVTDPVPPPPHPLHPPSTSRFPLMVRF